MMEYKSFGDSVKGDRYIKNEDHFLIKNEIGLHIVCDGFGEEGRGALASQMTTDFIAQVMLAKKKVFTEFKEKPTDHLRQEITQLVEQAVNKISLQILSIISKDSIRRQMGTTLSMVLVVGNGVFLAHIGNSRIYLLREDSLHLLTEDHVRKNQDKKAKIVDAELNTYGLSSTALTRNLGATQLLKVDLLYFEIMHGDLLFLCTDGVSDVLDNKTMVELLKDSKEENLSKAILNFVKPKNPNENASAITISFSPTKLKTEVTSPQNKFSTLLKIPLFSQLDYKEMTKLMVMLDSKKIAMNQNIVTEGESGEELYIILDGTAEVVKQNKTVAKLQAGDYFGELSLIDKEPRSATVKSTSNLEVLILKRKNFDFLISHEPEISVKMLWRFAQTLSARIRSEDVNPQNLKDIILNFD